jgi:hypothetical protein
MSTNFQVNHKIHVFSFLPIHFVLFFKVSAGRALESFKSSLRAAPQSLIFVPFPKKIKPRGNRFATRGAATASLSNRKSTSVEITVATKWAPTGIEIFSFIQKRLLGSGSMARAPPRKLPHEDAVEMQTGVLTSPYPPKARFNRLKNNFKIKARRGWWW